MNVCTVVYIMSDRRSGSTLLENILSHSKQTLAIGELLLLKQYILKEELGNKWKCSCGKAVTNCPFWSSVLSAYKTTPETQIKWQFKAARHKSLKHFLKIIKTPENQQTTQNLLAIYKTIAEQTGSSFIIDSSKDPLQALAVHEASDPQIEIKVIWLTRDLRAIASSKRKWSIKNKKPTKSLLQWLLNSFYYKSISRKIYNYLPASHKLKFSYEFIASHPQEAVQKIASFLKIEPFAPPEYMSIDNLHTIAGTPTRFQPKPIALDNSWKELYKQKKFLNIIGAVLNKIT